MGLGWVQQERSSGIISHYCLSSISTLTWADLSLGQTHPSRLALGSGFPPCPQVCQIHCLYPVPSLVVANNLTLPAYCLFQEHYQPQATPPTMSLLWKYPPTSPSDTG